MSPFGADRERCSNIGFDYVSLPPVVSPGQQVPVQLKWNFLNPCTGSAVTYMNAFGDWQPGTELARLINGQLSGSTRTMTNAFTFTAPSTPGTYRIRIPFVESFGTVTNFYGGPPSGPSAPGVGAYTEVAFTVATAPSYDYFLTDTTGNAGFMSPFGADRERCSNVGFDYVSLPPVVSPGQQVPVQLKWNFLNPCTGSAVTYMNVFGDWQPGTELARLINGQLSGSTRTVTNAFTFTAPTTPGVYRIRIPFVEAFGTVTNFYGGPSIGSSAPGVGAYAEVTFTVATPPSSDYFLTDATGNAGFMSPFGVDRDRCSNIGFDYVSLPPVVSPGQQVPVELKWNFLSPCSSGTVIYMNAFGDWQPGTELARLINGELSGNTRTETNAFTFTAPTAPGVYRIRIPFVEAFGTVTNFYGGPSVGSSAPGVGAYTEVTFVVVGDTGTPVELGLVYSEDFSSSPRWVTDDQAKLRQDPATGTFHGTQVNTEGTYASIDLPTFNPNKEWRLQWDHRINSCDWSAGFTFGLMDSRISYPYNAGIDMSIGDMGYGTALWGLSGVFSPAWQSGTWYHSVMAYDPVSQQLSLAITNKADESVHMILARTVSFFETNTTRIGVSRLMMKNTGGGASGSATADYDLDNVRLYGEAAPMLVAGVPNTTVSPGGTAQLTVKALGSQPMSYQWFFNGSPASATGPTLTVANVGHAGTYCVIVTNTFGAITNCAYLSVLDLKMFAGISLAGPIGATYQIEYLDAVGGGSTWQPLVALTLTTPTTNWVDMASATQPKRFYRAVPLP